MNRDAAIISIYSLALVVLGVVTFIRERIPGHESTKQIWGLNEKQMRWVCKFYGIFFIAAGMCAALVAMYLQFWEKQ